MTIVNRDSFVSDGNGANSNGAEKGTVEVTLSGVTRRVDARRYAKWGWIVAYGMVGQYRTSAKCWPATVRSEINEDGKVSEMADFGRDDRSGRFNKINCIAFKPE